MDKKIKQIYQDMMDTCYGKDFYQYAGRGVVVCPEWKEDVKNFSEDMGDMPDGAELQRHDKNKGFNKKNCFWYNEPAMAVPINEVSADTTKLKANLKKLIKDTKK